MNPESVVRKRLRAWLPWLVHCFVLAVLLAQLVPAATQAQGGDNTLFLPAASAGGTRRFANVTNEQNTREQATDTSTSDDPTLGDWLPPVEGEIVEVLQASEVEKAEVASTSAYIDWWLVGNGNQTTKSCLQVPLPFDMRDFDGGRIRLIMQHETNPTDDITIIDYVIGFEEPGFYGSNNNYGGVAGWSRQGLGNDYKFILGDGVRHTLMAPWNWATVTDYNPTNNLLLPLYDVMICSHPYVYTRLFFYED